MSNQGMALGVNQVDGLKRQDALPGFCPLTEAVERLATTAGVEARGAIYTRVEVVEFILDGLETIGVSKVEQALQAL